VCIVLLATTVGKKEYHKPNTRLTFMRRVAKTKVCTP